MRWDMFGGTRDKTLETHKAIALCDGKLAQNGREAGGILLYSGAKGEHVTLGYTGIMRFTAGIVSQKGQPLLEKGQQLTVGTNGYFFPATSGDFIVGRCLDMPVVQGAISTGMFNFTSGGQIME